jgi:hypothetical protein
MVNFLGTYRFQRFSPVDVVMDGDEPGDNLISDDESELSAPSGIPGGGGRTPS